MTEGQLTEVGILCAGAAGAVIAMLNVFRASAKKLSADIPEYKADRATGEVIDRLRGEAVRLEEVIDRMHVRVHDMESLLDGASNRLTRARTEALGVYALVSQSPVDCWGEQRDDIERALLRIVDLRTD